MSTLNGLLPVSTRDVVRVVPAAYDVEAARDALDRARRRAGELWPDPEAPESRLPGYEEAAEAVRAAERRLMDVETALEARDGRPPVYLLRVPQHRDRKAFRAALIRAGARPVSQAEVLEGLRAAIKGAAAPDQVAALLEIVDQFEAAGRDGRADESLARDVAEIERVMRRAWPPYAALLGDQTEYLQVAPLVAAKLFLIGWENVAAPFKRVGGEVPDAVLEAIEERDLDEIGWRAFALMHPSKDQEKNSASPSRSDSSRSSMPAGPSHPTADPDGGSSASSTPGTPVC